MAGLQTWCNILTYISSINTWASGDSPLAQLVKELDLCLYLWSIKSCVFETQKNQSIISPFPLHGEMPKDPSLSKLSESIINNVVM